MKNLLITIVITLSACAGTGRPTYTPEERCDLARDALVVAQANLDAARAICAERAPCDAMPYAEAALAVATETHRAACGG